MKLSIGETVLILRRRKNWSRWQLARESGVSIFSVCLIENDSDHMRIDSMVKVFAAFDRFVEIGFVPKDKKCT